MPADDCEHDFDIACPLGWVETEGSVFVTLGHVWYDTFSADLQVSVLHPWFVWFVDDPMHAAILVALLEAYAGNCIRQVRMWSSEFKKQFGAQTIICQSIFMFAFPFHFAKPSSVILRGLAGHIANKTCSAILPTSSTAFIAHSMK